MTIRTTTQRVRFPSPREYVRITLAASPLAGMVRGMESGQREALVEALAGELTASLQPHARGRGTDIPAGGPRLVRTQVAERALTQEVLAGSSDDFRRSHENRRRPNDFPPAGVVGATRSVMPIRRSTCEAA